MMKKLSLINSLICNILKKEDNQRLLSIAVSQRAKFEGWLKFELASKLKTQFPDTSVEYPAGTKHVDIYFENTLLELKTPNTNFRIEGVETKSRPITKNIRSVIDDELKLHEIFIKNEVPAAFEGYFSFVLFPIDENDNYQKYLGLISETGRVEENVYEIVKIDNRYPVCVYTGKVKK